MDAKFGTMNTKDIAGCPDSRSGDHPYHLCPILSKDFRIAQWLLFSGDPNLKALVHLDFGAGQNLPAGQY